MFDFTPESEGNDRMKARMRAKIERKGKKRGEGEKESKSSAHGRLGRKMRLGMRRRKRPIDIRKTGKRKAIAAFSSATWSPRKQLRTVTCSNAVFIREKGKQVVLYDGLIDAVAILERRKDCTGCRMDAFCSMIRVLTDVAYQHQMQNQDILYDALQCAILVPKALLHPRLLLPSAIALLLLLSHEKEDSKCISIISASRRCFGSCCSPSALPDPLLLLKLYCNCLKYGQSAGVQYKQRHGCASGSFSIRNWNCPPSLLLSCGQTLGRTFFAYRMM